MPQNLERYTLNIIYRRPKRLGIQKEKKGPLRKKLCGVKDIHVHVLIPHQLTVFRK